MATFVCFQFCQQIVRSILNPRTLMCDYQAHKWTHLKRLTGTTPIGSFATLWPIGVICVISSIYRATQYMLKNMFDGKYEVNSKYNVFKYGFLFGFS